MQLSFYISDNWMHSTREEGSGHAFTQAAELQDGSPASCNLHGNGVITLLCLNETESVLV